MTNDLCKILTGFKLSPDLRTKTMQYLKDNPKKYDIAKLLEYKKEEEKKYNCFSCSGVPTNPENPSCSYELNKESGVCHWREVADCDLHKEQNGLPNITLSYMLDEYRK